MRYFTKEWYNDTVVAEMCFQLRKTQKADTFSEKFYQKLYATEKKAYIKYSKRTAKFERRKFDIAASGAEFDSNYEENLMFVKANLPQEILADIKDIRVLALGSVTYEVADRITRFCGQINNRCEATKRRYDEATDEVAERMGGSIPALFGELAGAPISSVCIEDGIATVTTSPEYTGTALKVTLGGAKLVETDDGIHKTMIHKYELLPCANDGIEFSLLTVGDDSSLRTLTFTANSVDIEEI